MDRKRLNISSTSWQNWPPPIPPQFYVVLPAQFWSPSVLGCVNVVFPRHCDGLSCWCILSRTVLVPTEGNKVADGMFFIRVSVHFLGCTLSCVYWYCIIEHHWPDIDIRMQINHSGLEPAFLKKKKKKNFRFFWVVNKSIFILLDLFEFLKRTLKGYFV